MKSRATVLRDCLFATGLICLASLFGVACGDDNGRVGGDGGGGERAETFEGTLTVLHMGDDFSNVQPLTEELILAGQLTEVEIGGYPRAVAKAEEIRAGTNASIAVHAGDALTGTLYHTFFEGEAMADMMNQLCFDAFVPGRHEFDGSDQGLARFLEHLDTDGGICDTAPLAVNIVAEPGTPLAPEGAEPMLKPWVVVPVLDIEVGIVGVHDGTRTRLSSNPLPTTEFLDALAPTQAAIDELRESGIAHVVLAAHMPSDQLVAFAAQLSGVDVLIAAESRQLLGDFTDLGLLPAGPYPTEAHNADGELVCVATAWEDAKALGELVVEFDDEGRVESCGGSTHLLLGSTFLRDEQALTGADLDAVLGEIDAHPGLSVVEPDPEAQEFLDYYATLLEFAAEEPLAEVPEDLCLEWVPGQGQSLICDVADTAAHGSDIAAIVAKAHRQASSRADIGYQNSGGVRTDIAAGVLTYGGALELLPFANTLIEFDLTGAEIRSILEEAGTATLADAGFTGAYPSAAGLRFDVDYSAPAGERFSNIEVMRRGEETWAPLDPAETYVLVTNSFIAGGGDGYASLAAIPEDRRVNTYIEYSQSFINYVLGVGTLEKLPIEEYSTQSFVPAP